MTNEQKKAVKKFMTGIGVDVSKELPEVKNQYTGFTSAEAAARTLIEQTRVARETLQEEGRNIDGSPITPENLPPGVLMFTFADESVEEEWLRLYSMDYTILARGKLSYNDCRYIIVRWRTGDHIQKMSKPSTKYHGKSGAELPENMDDSGKPDMKFPRGNDEPF